MVVHELLHAVGVNHEQARGDRGTFVNIVAANVGPVGTLNAAQNVAVNFSQAGNSFDRGTYDYTSIMHYFPTIFGVTPAAPANCPDGTPRPGTGGACTTITAPQPIPTSL